MEDAYKDRYKGEVHEPLEVFSLSFHDTIYYQMQFMAGKDLNPYLEKEDIEMMADEPPKIILRAQTEGMLMSETVEEKFIMNTKVAFDKLPGKKESVMEYMFQRRRFMVISILSCA